MRPALRQPVRRKFFGRRSPDRWTGGPGFCGGRLRRFCGAVNFVST